MEKLPLIIKDEEIYIGTWFLSQGFGVEHRALKRLVVKYKNEFEELGFVATPLQQIGKKERGRRAEEFLLMENLMKKEIVEIIDNDLYVGTWQLSRVFEVEHRSLKKTIQNNMQDIIEVGEIELKSRPLLENSILKKNQKKLTKKGPTINEYLLNEPQATFVILLLKGQYKTDKVSLVVKFKKHITTQFFKQRKLLAKLLNQKINAEWIAKREAGKIERRIETDTIKRFVEYAKTQGSQNAPKYYMVITKMQNNAMFSLEFLEQKYPNVRDMIDGFSLDALKMSDHIVDRAIDEGMNKALPYKEIYQLAKERVETFASAIGKTPMQQVLSLKKNIEYLK